MRLFLAVAAAAPLLLLATPASARPARCVIVAAGEEFRGPCEFAPQAGGSFSVTPHGDRVLTGDVTALSLTIVSPGLAEVRGLTRAGVNSRWGEARRARRDRACWDGSDFRLCVY
jgi:hypothetical protein